MFRQKPNREQNYQFIASVMREGNIDTIDKVRSHVANLKRKATRFSAIVLVVTVLLYLIFPKLIVIWFMLAFGALAWVWSSSFSTILLMKMYIERDLASTDSPSHSTEDK